MNSNSLSNYRRSCEESIRRSPLASVAIASLAGLVFNILPVGAFLGALTRMTLSLIKPALLVLGITKVIDLFRERSQRL